MNDMIGPGFRDALTVIGILLNIIIGLLIYIFQQQVAKTKEEVAAIKTANKEHEATNATDLKGVAHAIDTLKDEITNLHVTLPSEYVKQTVLAALQMDIKADMRMVFSKMDEMKDMLVNMGAERRKS